MSATAWVEELKSRDGARRLFVQHGADVLIWILLAALAIDAALILTSQLGQNRAPPPLTTQTAPMATTNPTLELATIVNAHLFGAAGSTNPAQAPTTSMPLVLAGVIAVRDPAKGRAIIGPNAGSARLYSVGNTIPGGAKLHAVYNDRVLLERNGALEALRLPRTIAPMSVVGRAALTTAQQLPTRDNGTLFNGLIRVQPVFNQGKLSGYRIFPGARNGAAVFNQLGLRPGDLITAVNGTALDDQARALEILGTLSSAASATVTVSRGGTPQEVNLNLAELDIGENAGGGAQNRPSGATAGRR